MIEMTIEEKIERLTLFLENKTYTYIRDKFGFGFNGYTQKIDTVKILFLDDELAIIPIAIKDIVTIDYSKKIKKQEDNNGNSS